jgi:hypothetical protein
MGRARVGIDRSGRDSFSVARSLHAVPAYRRALVIVGLLVLIAGVALVVAMVVDLTIFDGAEELISD